MPNPTFTQGMQIATTFDVSSEENGVVVYSISFQPTKRNRELAFAYVKEHAGAMMIEHTECGAKLVETGFENMPDLTSEEVAMIWAEASRRFIASAKGNVTAFVDNADPRSVFLTVELPNILKNDQIRTVNGTDKFEFAKRFDESQPS
jgi:hypothetical protein